MLYLINYTSFYQSSPRLIWCTLYTVLEINCRREGIHTHIPSQWLLPFRSREFRKIERKPSEKQIREIFRPEIDRVQRPRLLSRFPFKLHFYFTAQSLLTIGRALAQLLNDWNMKTDELEFDSRIRRKNKLYYNSKSVTGVLLVFKSIALRINDILWIEIVFFMCASHIILKVGAESKTKLILLVLVNLFFNFHIFLISHIIYIYMACRQS